MQAALPSSVESVSGYAMAIQPAYAHCAGAYLLACLEAFCVLKNVVEQKVLEAFRQRHRRIGGVAMPQHRHAHDSLEKLMQVETTARVVRVVFVLGVDGGEEERGARQVQMDRRGVDVFAEGPKLRQRHNRHRI
eukprot:scaffold24528_cov120-Isochrysis_galbana.AAC.2